MAFQIGFMAEHGSPAETAVENIAREAVAPRKSVVQVSFPDCAHPLRYYNDRFDLREGDRVFVEGSQAGVPGRVISVTYGFKIKLSEYKRVIAVADTAVQGEVFSAGTHLVSFDSQTIPSARVRGWFLPPVDEEDEVSSGDDRTFSLAELSRMGVTPAIAQRGGDYYERSRVRYLELRGERGFAIVEGERHYEIEFEYRSGEVSGLLCSCPCAYTCKHEFAAMLQLRETLEYIEKNHPEALERGYFAAVEKGSFLSIVMGGEGTQRITLG